MILKGNSKGINHNLLCRICIVYAFFRIQQKLLEFSNITAKNHLLCIFFATQTVQSYSKLYRFFLLSYISTKNFSLFLQYSAQLSTLLPYFCNLRNRNDLSSLVRIYIFTKRHDNRANGWIAVVKKETGVLATDSIEHRKASVRLSSSFFQNVSIADFTARALAFFGIIESSPIVIRID